MHCRRFLLTCTLVALLNLAAAGQGQPGARDQQGDPLPPGAVVRLGALRWRHDDVVAFAAFLPDGKSVVSVGADHAIRVWAFPSGQQLRAISVAPELKDGKEAKAVFGPFGNSGMPEIVAALSKDGKTIATWLGGKAPGPFSGNLKADGPKLPPIHLHDVATGKELPALKIDGFRVASLLFAPTGEHLMSADVQGGVSVWDWAAAKHVRTIAAAEGQTPTGKLGGPGLGRTSPENKYAFAPDGKSLLIYGTTRLVQVLDIQTGQRTGEGAPAGLASAHFSSDSKQIITQAADGSMRKWDALSGKDLGSIKTSMDDTAKMPPKIASFLLKGTNQCASRDGQIAVSYSKGGGTRRTATLFETATGKEVSKITFENAGPSGANSPQLAFSPDNKLLAACSAAEEKTDLYDVRTGKRLLSLSHKFLELPAPESKPAAPVKKFGGKGKISQADQTIIFSPDSKIVAAKVGPQSLLLWDTATGNRLVSLTLPGAGSFDNGAFTPDSRCLALDMNDGTVAVYELASAQLRRSFGKIQGGAKEAILMDPFQAVPFGGSNEPLSNPRVAVSADGKCLAYAGPDRVIHVWDIASGAALAAFKGHSAEVKAIDFAPDGKSLVSASDDTTALVWDTTKLQRPLTPKKALAPAELTAAWDALAANDAAKAFSAMCDLAAAPQAALALMQKELKPATPIDRKHVDELIAQLDSDQYKVREKATNDLLKIGERIIPAIDAALAKQPPLETRRRLEELRNKTRGAVLQGERLRDFRGVELLEQIGTPEARQVLRGLAQGDPEAMITSSSRAALKRLGS